MSQHHALMRQRDKSISLENLPVVAPYPEGINDGPLFTSALPRTSIPHILLRTSSLPNRLIRVGDTVEPQQRRYIDEMIEKGWCSHQAVSLAQKFDLKTFHFLAQLEVSPLRIKDHTTCAEKPWCCAYNVDMSTSRTKHCDVTCSCDFLSVPYDELTAIIRDGDIPLVSIEDDRHLQKSLRLHRRKFKSKYSAISHVWTDGLGNSESNSFPRCQIQRFAEMFVRLHDSYGQLFWFDTLCIPVKDEDVDLRNESIDDMGSIYAEAEMVLVLDAELMDIGTSDTETNLARTICSVWMCRSWTLQEGILAKRCAFVFPREIYLAEINNGSDRFEWRAVGKNSVYSIESEREWHAARGCEIVDPGRDWTPYVDHTLPSEIERYNQRSSYITNLEMKKSIFQKRFEAYLLHEFFGIGIQGSSHERYDRFIFAWNALTGRSTAKSDDIYLTLANLLGFSCRWLITLPPEKRLGAIILGIGAVPFSLLMTTSKRYGQGRFHLNRWMPIEISRDLLARGPSLGITGKSLQLRHYEAGENSELSIFIVKEVVPSSLMQGTFIIPHQNAAYHFTISPVDATQHDLTDFQYTCFVVDNGAYNMNNEGYGAIFYASSWSKSSKGDRLSLVYHCAIRIQQLPETRDIGILGNSNIYSAEAIRRIHRIAIEYDASLWPADDVGSMLNLIVTCVPGVLAICPQAVLFLTATKLYYFGILLVFSLGASIIIFNVSEKIAVKIKKQIYLRNFRFKRKH